MGKPLPVDIYATAFTETYPRGIELSGVRFNVILVEPGLDRDYAIARHGARDYRIPLGEGPTTDPRDEVQQIRAVFNVPMQPIEPPLDPSDVFVSSQQGVPSYTVSFPGGGDVGTELTILFDRPLEPGLYGFDFRSFVDLDLDPLTGIPRLVLRVLPGDADDNGDVSEEDVAYVRNRINAPLANSAIAGADPNRTGSITGTDISYVRARIGRGLP